MNLSPPLGVLALLQSKKLERTLSETLDNIAESICPADDAITGFNHFLSDQLPFIFKSQGPIITEAGNYIHSLQLCNPMLITPRTQDTPNDAPRILLPTECKHRNMSYLAGLTADIHLKTFYRNSKVPATTTLPLEVPGSSTSTTASTASTTKPQTADSERFFLRKKVQIPERPLDLEESLKLRFWSPHIDLEQQAKQDNRHLINYTIETGVQIGRIPVMLKSDICHLSREHTINDIEESGGTFIIGGQSKIILRLSSLQLNTAYIYAGTGKVCATMEVRSGIYDRQAMFSTSTIYLEYMNISLKSPTTGQELQITLPFIKKPIAFSLVIKALGWNQIMFECAIRTFVVSWHPEYLFKLVVLFRSTAHITTQEMALLSMYSMSNSNHWNKSLTTEEQAESIRASLQMNLLPHVEGLEGKLLFLAFHVARMFQMTTTPQILPWDDRDCESNKRSEMAGSLYASLVRQVISGYSDHIRKLMEKSYCYSHDIKISKVVKDDFITARLCFALTTGQWSSHKTGGGTSRKNVSQPFQATTMLSMVSHHMRRHTTVNPDGKHSIPRQVHTSSLGVMCPFETPEGKHSGLVANKSLGDRISVGSDPLILRSILEGAFASRGADMFTPLDAWFDLCARAQEYSHRHKVKLVESFAAIFQNHFSIWLDGGPIGWTTQPEEYVQFVRFIRKQRAIDPEVSITLDSMNRQIRIATCAGRSLHPLINLQSPDWVQIESDSTSLPGLSELEHLGILEYIDTDEIKNCVIAFSVQDAHERLALLARRQPLHQEHLHFTHIEIHPILMMGASAALIPFSDHNQCPRNAYQASMNKQAIDWNMHRNPTQMNASHSLDYPQRPLVSTRIGQKLMNGALQLSGQVAIVAVMCDSSNNQEDAFSVSYGFRERGGGSTTYTKLYRDSQKNVGPSTTRDIFQQPKRESCSAMKFATYDLTPEGLPPLGSRLHRGSIVIGKTRAKRSPPGPASKESGDQTPQSVQQDVSTVHMGGPCTVSYVHADVDGHGVQIRKVMVREERLLQIGDKITTDHSQKGCIGHFFSQEDAPFSVRDGVTPDIIIHPAGIVGRHTYGQQYETLVGLATAINPTLMRSRNLHDGTPYNAKRLPEVMQILKEAGYNPSGKQSMMCGKTGKLLDAHIFMGPTNIHKLWHMIVDKIHARGNGPVNALTQQPVSGRTEMGGLRVGEMERDVYTAYGLSATLLENLGTASDPCDLYLCKKCGSMAEVNIDIGYSYCRYCDESHTAVTIKSVYSLKILYLELAAMGIRLKLNVEERT